MLAVFKLRLLQLKDMAGVLAAMIGLSLMMTLVFAGAGTSKQDTLVALTAPDAPEVERLKEALEEGGDISFIPADISEGKELLRRGDVMAHLVFPQDVNETESISLTSNRSDLETGALTRQIEDQLATQRTLDRAVKLLSKEMPDLPVHTIERTLESQLRRRSFVTIDLSIADTGSRTAYVADTLIGFTVLFAAFSLVFGIGEIITEKKEGTYWRLMISPLSRTSILLGNALSTVLIGLFQMGLVFAVGGQIFGLTFLDRLPGLLLFSGLYVSAMVAYGLLFSTFISTPGQLGAFSPLVLIAMGMLGGCLWPLEIVQSPVLLGLSVLTPHRWALEGLRGLAVGSQSIMDLTRPLVMLLLLLGCAVLWAGRRIRKESPGT